MDEPALKIDQLHKNFILPHEKRGSIKHVFTNVFKPRNPGAEVQRALKNISFEVKPGEFFGIVGRNGSGKSTLLKILAGIYQPTKGGVAIRGKLVPFIELGVGFNPELTGRENVYLNGALLGFSKKEIMRRYDQIVAFAELERFMDQKLKNYSSGMQVRLAFSLAVCAEADILLVDEVLAVGDADFQRKCYDYFRNLKKNKTTVVFVSHDMNAVREYCDRAILIEDGKITARGHPSEVSTEYTKLFSETAEAEMSGNGKRWGKAGKLISEVKVPTKISRRHEHIDIEVTVKANQKLVNPIVGYVVKNAMGESLTGTNTKIERAETGMHEAGGSFTVNWTLPNMLADGKYYVDVAVLDRDGITVLDWWETAARFTVFEENPSPYVLSPAVKTKVIKA